MGTRGGANTRRDTREINKLPRNFEVGTRERDKSRRWRVGGVESLLDAPLEVSKKSGARRN